MTHFFLRKLLKSLFVILNSCILVTPYSVSTSLNFPKEIQELYRELRFAANGAEPRLLLVLCWFRWISEDGDAGVGGELSPLILPGLRRPRIMCSLGWPTCFQKERKR